MVSPFFTWSPEMLRHLGLVSALVGIIGVWVDALDMLDIPTRQRLFAGALAAAAGYSGIRTETFLHDTLPLLAAGLAVLVPLAVSLVVFVRITEE